MRIKRCNSFVCPTFIFLSLSFLTVSAFAVESAPAAHDFSTVKSPRTETITKLANDLAASPSAFGKVADGELIQLDCLETAGNELYVGVKQFMDIQADLNKVDAVLMNIAEFKDLFPGYKETKITDRDGNKLLTFWEQKIPFFFVPNVKYEMVYQLEQPSPTQRLYRYQLHKAGELKVSDGFILIRQENDHLTHYVEYDFFDAEWGLAKVAGKHKIWEDSVEGLLHSDLAAKAKIENPSWSSEKARKESKKQINHALVDACYKNRTKLP